MNGEERRQQILADLTEANSVINATMLAEKLGVTRQVIVADIALLRAAGHAIRAEHRGYVLDKSNGEILKKIVCRHPKDKVAEEFYAVVDNGGKVVDVQIEHMLYGTISTNLSICSRYDADEFIRQANATGASHLADLTGGRHIHTISVKDEETYDRIVKKLKELGVLIEEV